MNTENLKLKNVGWDTHTRFKFYQSKTRERFPILFIIQSSVFNFQYHSRFLCILPLVVFGRESRKTTIRGYLYGAVWVLT